MCDVFAKYFISMEIRDYLPTELKPVQDILDSVLKNPCETLTSFLGNDKRLNATLAYNVLDNTKGLLQEIMPLIKVCIID